MVRLWNSIPLHASAGDPPPHQAPTPIPPPQCLDPSLRPGWETTSTLKPCRLFLACFSVHSLGLNQFSSLLWAPPVVVECCPNYWDSHSVTKKETWAVITWDIILQRGILMHRFLKLNEAIEKYLFCFLCICRCLPEYIYFVYIFHCADICAYIYIYMGVYCIYTYLDVDIFRYGWIPLWLYLKSWHK